MVAVHALAGEAAVANGGGLVFGNVSSVDQVDHAIDEHVDTVAMLFNVIIL